MYKLLMIYDMLGNKEELGNFESLNEIYDYLKNKLGFYVVEHDNSWLTIQVYGNKHILVVSDFGTLN